LFDASVREPVFDDDIAAFDDPPSRHH
jgi:hypothetical protein